MQPENIMLMHGTLMPPPLSAAGPFEWDAATHLTLIDLGSAVSDYFPPAAVHVRAPVQY